MTRICVIDDKDILRLVFREILEDEGYTVVAFADGSSILEYLRVSLEPVVVLLDLLLPTMDGAAVLTAVAADPALSTRHAYVLMTGQSLGVAMNQRGPEDLTALLHQLHVPVLEKPFGLEELLDVLTEAQARLSRSALASA